MEPSEPKLGHFGRCPNEAFALFLAFQIDTPTALCVRCDAERRGIGVTDQIVALCFDRRCQYYRYGVPEEHSLERLYAGAAKLLENSNEEG